MMKTLLLALFLCLGVAICHGHFLTKTSNKTFEMRLMEDGTNLTQKIELDEENGMIIYETPAHNGRQHTTFYQDTETGLQLNVHHGTKSCTFEQAFVSVNMQQQKETLEQAELVNDPDNDRLVVEPSQTLSYDLFSIPGPSIDDQDLPVKFQKLCPAGYPLNLARLVNGQGIVFGDGNQSTTIMDPMVQQKDLKNGDDPSSIFDDLFDILPPSAEHKRKRRYCMIDGKRKNNCFFQTVSCPSNTDGCDAEDMGYDCSKSVPGCYYTLVCPTARGAQCLAHVMDNQGFNCKPCCRRFDCGTNMPKCSYMGRPSCPSNGCPLEDVQTKYNPRSDPKVDWECVPDGMCDYVMSANKGDVNQGSKCQTYRGDKKVRGKKLCCNNNNARSNLPRC